MSDPFNVSAGQTAYEAASHGRRMAGWRASNAGPNTAVTAGFETLRKRSRDACRNSAIANSVVSTWTRSLVGFGISARPVTDDQALKAKLNALWTAWCKVANTDEGDFSGLQQLAVRSWLEAGECFIRIRPRRPEDYLPVPMQLQMLESDCVPLLDTDNATGLPAGNVIRSGIELDKLGRRVAYWFWKEHPADRPLEALSQGNKLVRVPAEQVCHLYEPTRPGQLRGAPILAPVLAKMRTLDDFNDALLTRQHLANLFTMFIVKPFPSGANDAMTGQAFEGDPNDPLAALEPGISMELRPGEDVKFSAPPAPDAAYSEYMRSQLLELAAGAGMPYELLTGDLVNVSDRTLRININEFRRACEARIWGVIIPRVLDKVRAAWATAAALSGALLPTEAQAALTVQWAPQAWPYLHPTQDIQARKLEVDNGFRSRASVIAERGDDPEQVDTERAADNQRASDMGLETLDERKVAAEVAKLEAEAAAAQKNADAATQRTTKATRTSQTRSTHNGQ
jgi:lambda family phage portal protein